MAAVASRPVDRLPLGAELVIVEPLGLQRLGGRGEAAELVARLRQIGAASSWRRATGCRVGLKIRPRRGDHNSSRAAEVGAGRAQIVDLQLEAVEAQAGDDLEHRREADLVLDVDRGDGRLGPVVGVARRWTRRSRRHRPSGSLSGTRVVAGRRRCRSGGGCATSGGRARSRTAGSGRSRRAGFPRPGRSG